MTIDEMIAVLQAAKAGKQIERHHMSCESDWRPVDLASDISFMRYRVKPEPREWVAEILPSGHLRTMFDGIATYDGPVIRVREVL